MAVDDAPALSSADHVTPHGPSPLGDQDIGAIDDLLRPLTAPVNEDTLRELARGFSDQYAHLAKNSLSHFLPTPAVLPSGQEQGIVLGIDVGGTNLRVGFIELLADDASSDAQSSKIRRHHEKAWPIEEHLKMDKAEDLFVWIGDCLAEVILAAIEAEMEFAPGSTSVPDELPLGVTFSFPMTQNSISEATLLPMGKGFAIKSDLNLREMLLAGYSRHCEASVQKSAHAAEGTQSLPKLRIAAIANDTVATFAASAYASKASANSRVAMGLIVGTGTNATVPMKLGDLHVSKQASLDVSITDETPIIINTEWSIEGTDVPMRDLGIPTKWDEELDANCDRPGFQPFEYMTSGRYLGELVRLVFVDYCALLFASDLSPMLGRRNVFSTTQMAALTTVAQEDYVKVLNESFTMLPKYVYHWNPIHFTVLRAIALAVQVRASALIAAAIVGLLACIGELSIDPEPVNGDRQHQAAGFEDRGSEELIVAYTGGLISKYPSFLETCEHWIDKLVRGASAKNGRKQVVLREALDGGIIGAAVLASMEAVEE